MSAPGDTSDRLAEVARGTPPAGWRVWYTPEVGSTQDVARQAARAGAPSRSVYVCDHQTAGRGRQGRPWVAPPGSALLLSILFREESAAPEPGRYTRLVSVALAEAVERVAPGLAPTVKWPNDLLLGGRKVAGVLAEAAWDGERLAVIVGAGTNVSTSRAALDAVAPRATSLAAEAGEPVDRGALLRALLERLDAWLSRSQGELLAAWQRRLWGRGQPVRLRGLDGGVEEQEVVVLGAEADGALRVRLAGGAERVTAVAELIL